MSLRVQIVVDAHDPHDIADWWAETLGWEVEHQDPSFIRSMIDQGLATDDDTVDHRGALVWKTAAAINAPGGEPGSPRILFQKVAERKSVKNRVHLDIRGHEKDREAFVKRLTDRGAEHLWSGQQGPHHWDTFRDPEGNEFCV